MNQIADSKGVYAQSSDIKSRSYLEYRQDMKRKAIVELETLDWFERKLKARHQTDSVTVGKSGGDADIWFTRSGKISGEPDYRAVINGVARQFEFQYSNQSGLPYYDFKVSKVGPKVKGRRVPHTDRTFLYIIKPLHAFAIFEPEWVFQNGTEAGVPAWGNRTAFRVPGDVFEKIFEADHALAEVIGTIDKKISLLDLQTRFLDDQIESLSAELQGVIDYDREFKIIPRTLHGFYRACLLMNRVGREPINRAMWLVYGASFYANKINSLELAQLMYALDFLYGGADDLDDNVLLSFVDTMRKISVRMKFIQQNDLRTDTNLSPRDEAVNFLFTVNLYEDIAQELRTLYGVDCFPPIRRIFQTLVDVDSMYRRF